MIVFHLTFIKHSYSTMFSETDDLQSCKKEEANYGNRQLQWSLLSIFTQLFSSADPSYLRKRLCALSESHQKKIKVLLRTYSFSLLKEQSYQHILSCTLSRMQRILEMA